ncbi:MAG TPA: nucleoside deaminase [Chloroflexota bacterium]|nr:nucleoside deaminase [Chloroflexota bacterium]
MIAPACFDTLPDGAAWRTCFELAWEAFRAGSIPVGALVVDAEGRIVSVGRNRIYEDDAPSGELRGTFLAHAEINALAALPPGHYPDHTLYTTLEPCLLCTAASVHSHIGTVRFAGIDPLWEGVVRLPEINAHVARRWPQRIGPLPHPLALWGTLLPLLRSLELYPDGVVVETHHQTMPALVALGRDLINSGEMDRLADVTLDAALEVMWARLESCLPAAPTESTL